jgi:putative transposase
VSRNAIRARINQLDPLTRTRTRLGASAARREHDPTPGHFHVDRPLDSVQIDHALADVIVVDERDREAIGRPWLTMAIDVYSRGVSGFYVTLEPPSVTSIGRAEVLRTPWVFPIPVASRHPYDPPKSPSRLRSRSRCRAR